MQEKTQAQLTAAWAAHFNMPAERLQVPGTTCTYLPTRDPEAWAVVLWPIGSHVIAQCSDAAQAAVKDLLARQPDRFCLDAETIATLPAGPLRCKVTEYLYVLEAENFIPFNVDPPLTIRRLVEADRSVFNSFQNRCEQQEVHEADVNPGHEMACGVFDGERLVAVASVYTWHGLADVGILTEPGYRGRGLGKAAVSWLASHYLAGDRLFAYRHGVENVASGKIAGVLGFTRYAEVMTIVRQS